jgi:hypothetical protein
MYHPTGNLTADGITKEKEHLFSINTAPQQVLNMI